MNLNDLHIVYFIGIGGIGMSAIARFFAQRGVKVSGYDKTKTPLTQQLELEGIDIHYEDSLASIPENIDLVVYTPAIPKEHLGMNHLKGSGVPLMKRSEVLGMITQNMKAFAVAGTHGKTTTSSMVAHILHETIGANAFIGGVMSNYNSNFIGNSKVDNVVVEADEFDRSFLTLYPERAVITSLDPDHLDIYGEASQLLDSFSAFASQVKGDILLKDGLSLSGYDGDVIRYGIDSESDYSAQNVTVSEGKYQFDVKFPGGQISNISLGLAGRHNVENATAAFGLVHRAGLEAEQIKEALSSYKGVKRRFDYIVEDGPTTYIDDYAHHPEELNAAIASARELFPGKKITGIFQPHLFSRTRDFEDGFANALAALDELYLLDIYPAREKPIEGVNSANLLEKVKLDNKKLVQKNEVIDQLKQNQPEVLMTLGAGDIDQLIEPIKMYLSEVE